MATDAGLVEACLAGDEPHALDVAGKLAAAGAESANLIYASTKAALNRWLRRSATTADWAGAHIPLNAVGPGVILTPMTEGWTATPQGRAYLDAQVPMPLTGFGRPEQVAVLLAYLASPQNALVTGQIVFADGGSDVVLRGESAW
jgi:NAD(P)-dependent dehydrogenase (short-subunit alcohol dehydrogenase family)